MVITLWSILFILLLLWVTYPKDFPTFIRDPELLFEVVGLESKRRWLMLKYGTLLYFERQWLRFSLWRARGTIAAERAKQKLQEETNID